MDHIPVHHNNEIAQSECANGKPLARYWLHEAFVTMRDEKISKSVGNVVYLSDIVEQGIHPLALRYFFLQAHYRTPVSFTWEALAAAQEGLARLWKLCRKAGRDAKGIAAYGPLSERMRAFASDDLATPKMVALLWEALQDDTLSPKEIWGAVLTADAVLGLSLSNPPYVHGAEVAAVPAELQELLGERETARRNRDFARADELRIHIENRGYAVEDTPAGPRIVRK